MGIKGWIKTAGLVLFGRETAHRPPVERKWGDYRSNLGHTPLYGGSGSGEKVHILRQESLGKIYLCGAHPSRYLSMFSHQTPCPESLCKTCSRLYDGGAR